MQIADLEQIFSLHPEIDILAKELSRTCNKHFLLRNLFASSQSLFIHALSLKLATIQHARPMMIVVDNADDAQYIYADLRTLSSEQGVYFFPTSHRRRQKTDDAMLVQRTEVLTALLAEHHSLKTSSTEPLPIIVTYPEALAEPVPMPQALQQQTIKICTEQTLLQSLLIQQLIELRFQRVDFVYEPGQFAVRGGIVDIYSYAHDYPYRVDFFGDEVDSIREFDIETQLSKNRVTSIDIVGANIQEDFTLITSYLADDVIWVSNDYNLVHYKMQGLLPTPTPIHSYTTIEIGQKSSFASYDALDFDTLPQPTFNKNFDILIDNLSARTQDGYKIYILADQVKQTDRLRAIFEDKDSNITFIPINQTLHAGFVDNSAKICCYTDHQIFERYHRVTLQSENARRGKAIITLKEINQLQVGDYVVHTDHGIGQFAGLVTTHFYGRPQECIKLTYRGGDTIFVSIHNLHRISKYKGREGSEPTISRLGSGAWERMKERTKDKVKDIARDLIRIYATRKQQQGFSYSPDGYMQHELEASFFYEDTPDQAKATLDIKHDMESPMPMDRLVCGDVGFGKTEVAMRAAFKAATDGKQVAVLVPTTVLAMQHYNTFRERFRDFPIRVEYISRRKTTKEIKEILANLKTGQIDILIGTHKLVGKQVEWKDLGLLIIDEEQKFGVSTKEKLRQMKTNVDTLTLTATPIPRTLQFSLMGARDLSVIQTPPPNRYPIQTQVCSFSSDVIAEAVEFEMSRNGQVYIVSNRISSLPELEAIVHKYVPDARVVTGHGQMSPEKLEEIILGFVNYDYDVLISTTIIESGIDIPNANTIIVCSAQNFGLSDLHQMRGRVGRSNRKAFCYLLAPPFSGLNPEARRRLQAIETFSDLGSGIHIAMQDLDIRGAGNLLGAEQSGFIADLGYETYQKILSEAVKELRNEEFQDLYAEENQESKDAHNASEFVDECLLETDLDVRLPESYVPTSSERMLLYRELGQMEQDHQIEAFRTRLIDRFGPLPQEAEDLCLMVKLRRLGKELGGERLTLKNKDLRLYFVQSEQSPYYQGKAFGQIVAYCTVNLANCQLTARNGHKFMNITNVPSIASAISVLENITQINI